MPKPHRILCRHIEAGALLSEALASWSGADRALRALSTRFPEHDANACLLKTAVINALYSTNLYAVSRMAEHIRLVLGNSDRVDGPALVDHLATFKKRQHRSFASKYAHFSIDPEQYPIYDQYVLKMLAHHLGSNRVWPSSYVEFANWFDALRPLCETPSTPKEIDQYLWMAGMARMRGSPTERYLSKDVQALFACDTPAVKQALENLA